MYTHCSFIHTESSDRSQGVFISRHSFVNLSMGGVLCCCGHEGACGLAGMAEVLHPLLAETSSSWKVSVFFGKFSVMRVKLTH